MLTRLVVLALVAAAVCVRAGAVCENRYPDHLDVGIYWASLDASGAVTWAKACGLPETLPTGFDPARNTLVLTHGLQPDFVRKGLRFWVETEEMQFVAPWLAKGWNVGIFQWTQFADEPLMRFERAEAKIWTPAYFADMKYNYMASDGVVRVADAPTDKCVADYFVAAYADHAPRLMPGVEVRFVGHSLGSQLALRTAALIQADARIDKKVDRVALLDPVFSPDQKGYLLRSPCGPTVERQLGCMAKDLHAHGVAIEYYKFSFMNRCVFSSQQNNDLVRHSAFAQPTVYTWGDRRIGSCYADDLFNDPTEITGTIHDIQTQMKNQHIVAVPYYLLSLVGPPHRCTMVGDTCVRVRSLALGAAMPTDDVLYWAQEPAAGADKQCFHQYDDGQRDDAAATVTPSSADDTFYVKTCQYINS